MLERSSFVPLLVASLVAACGGRVVSSSASSTDPGSAQAASPNDGTERDAGPELVDVGVPGSTTLSIDGVSCSVTVATVSSGGGAPGLWSAVVNGSCTNVGDVSVYVTGQYDQPYPQTLSNNTVDDVDLGLCSDDGGCFGYQYGASPMYGHSDSSYSLDYGPTTTDTRAFISFSAVVGRSNGGTATHNVTGTIAAR